MGFLSILKDFFCRKERTLEGEKRKKKSDEREGFPSSREDSVLFVWMYDEISFL